MKAVLKMTISIDLRYDVETKAGRPLTIADFKGVMPSSSVPIGDLRAAMATKLAEAKQNGFLLDEITSDDQLITNESDGTFNVCIRWEDKDALVEYANWRFNTPGLPSVLEYEIIDIV